MKIVHDENIAARSESLRAMFTLSKKHIAAKDMLIACVVVSSRSYWIFRFLMNDRRFENINFPLELDEAATLQEALLSSGRGG